jgi:hypothetical protein
MDIGRWQRKNKQNNCPAHRIGGVGGASKHAAQGEHHDSHKAAQLDVDVHGLLPAGGLLDAAERVDASVELALQGATGVFGLLADAVAGVVEGVVDTVAFVVVDGHLAVGVVVVVADPAGVGQGHALELAHGVILVGGGSVAHSRAQKPLPQVVGVGGDHPVGVDVLEHLAVLVVFGVLGCTRKFPSERLQAQIFQTILPHRRPYVC